MDCLVSSKETNSLESWEESLNRKYVYDNILTTTDQFLEEILIGNLRNWHLIFMIAFSLIAVVKIRIPRTKVSIEANAKRKSLLKNFQSKLKELKNAELDHLDYRKALERLRDEFKADSESLAQSEAFSILSLYDEST